MNRIIIFCFLFFSINTWAQERCAHDHEMAKAMSQELEYARSQSSFDSLSSAYEKGEILAPGESREDFFIPVVVHVVYRLEEQNISYDQIISQIDILNRDFNWAASDKDKIPEVFREVGLASKIQFRLADKDPWGNHTNGITRTQTEVEDIGSRTLYHRSTQGGKNPWPQAHYLNIWVCELEGEILGFSILPSSNMSERDGVVMSPYAFGTGGIVRTPYDQGRTLVHEVGHYLGLRHPWGGTEYNGCTNTDYMSDTPPQFEENFGCEDFPHFSCPGAPDGDMFMNFMDYGDDSCMLLFTNRQVGFMRLVLMTSRVTLFNSEGYTGVEDQETTQVKIFPNPAGDWIKVELPEVPDAPFIIRDVRGRIIEQWVMSSLRSQFDVKWWDPGVYFLEYEQERHQIIKY